MPVPEEILVRAYSPGDLGACRELWAQLVDVHRELYSDLGIGGETPGRHFDEYLERAGKDRIWVAEMGGRLVGLTGILSSLFGTEVEPLIVHEEHRGAGIGSLLLDHAVRKARAMGDKGVSVKPVARNRRALDFFRRRGFEVVGQVELYKPFGDGLDEFIPGLTLHDFEFRY